MLIPTAKMQTAMHMLVHRVSANAIDNYVCISESTAIEYFEKFIEDEILVFKIEYLQKPNSNDVQCLLQMGED